MLRPCLLGGDNLTSEGILGFTIFGFLALYLSSAGPHCLLIVYRCTRTHLPCSPPVYSTACQRNLTVSVYL